LDRRHGAGGNAPRNLRAALEGGPQNPRDSGNQGTLPCPGPGARGQHAGGIRRVPQTAERPIRLDREAGGPEAGLNTSVSKDMTEKLRPIRRLVTGNDDHRPARVLFPTAPPTVKPGAGTSSAGMTDIWVFHSCPAV